MSGFATRRGKEEVRDKGVPTSRKSAHKDRNIRRQTIAPRSRRTTPRGTVGGRAIDRSSVRLPANGK
jgi:hypothetical protein